MRICKLNRASLAKIAVLLTGLAAAILAVTLSPQAAHAFPSKQQDCTNCHGVGTPAGTVNAVPSTSTPAAGATYTVLVTEPANAAGGDTGYWIANSTAAGVTGTSTGVYAGNDGTLAATRTATMTAPAAAGTYWYKVWAVKGHSDATGVTNFALYSITVVPAASVPVSSFTTSVASGAFPLPVTMTDTSTNAPTSWAWNFGNGTTSTLKSPSVTYAAAGTYTVTLTASNAIGAGNTATKVITVTAPVVAGIHGPYPINSAQCGTCHRVHTAKAPNLQAKRSPSSLGSQSTLCLSCHDGTGSNKNVAAQYALVRPINTPATREYYSHDAVDANPVVAHTESKLNEFGGVSNRHSECSDCHNAHQATAVASADSTQTATGWDTTRRLAGVSGVSVVNSFTPGAAPTYTFLSGVDTNVVPANLVTREYQLCFKCHSGFTTLTSNAGLKLSQYALDKAIEFNPNNPSFHPVEAPGKNTTTAMAASLAGTSPYKLWNFTVGQTVRCLNCHASSQTPGTAPLPRPGSALAPHTSVNRGILIRNYRDRLLKPFSGTDFAYSAGDFALCYVCHAEAPFVDGTSTATNFNLHAKHISLLAPVFAVVGTDIDTPGDGRGKATCAECHYRLHSTTNKVGAQVVDGTRLVNFAPNVQPNGPVFSWTAKVGNKSGSCTLTCHGHAHTSRSAY